MHEHSVVNDNLKRLALESGTYYNGCMTVESVQFRHIRGTATETIAFVAAAVAITTQAVCYCSSGTIDNRINATNSTAHLH